MARTQLTDVRLMAEVTKGLAEGSLTPHYRHLAMQKGLVKYLSFRKPGTRGRVKIVAVLTELGEKFYNDHKGDILQELKKAA